MKRIALLLMAVVMLASACCVQAEETAQEAAGITFQGIPWGSSVEEVRAWLVSNHVCNEDVHEWLSRNEILDVGTVRLSVEEVVLSNMGIGCILREDGSRTGTPEGMEMMFPAIQFNASELHPDYRVLGVAPKTITFTFRYDGESTGLISVAVSIERKSSVFKQLYGDMTDLYGADETPGNEDFETALLLADLSGDWKYRKAGENATMVSYQGSTLAFGKTDVLSLPDN